MRRAQRDRARRCAGALRWQRCVGNAYRISKQFYRQFHFQVDVQYDAQARISFRKRNITFTVV